jgi:DNA repair protein RadC
MIMRKDDLTRFKHVGVSRMKLLNDLGITTIKQLYEMPEEKLAEIKSIGEHHAKQIKAKIVSAKQRKTEEINRDLKKKINRLRNNLKRVNENLKPLGKKKYLESYIDFKKRSTKLETRLNEIGQIQEDLPKKVKRNIIKKADALNLFLKGVGKKPKKKKYKKVTLEVQSFSKMLRDVIS